MEETGSVTVVLSNANVIRFDDSFADTGHVNLQDALQNIFTRVNTALESLYGPDPDPDNPDANMSDFFGAMMPNI